MTRHTRHTSKWFRQIAHTTTSGVQSMWHHRQLEVMKGEGRAGADDQERRHEASGAGRRGRYDGSGAQGGRRKREGIG